MDEENLPTPYEKAREAHRLRVEGLSWAEAAEAVGYANNQVAQTEVRAMLQRAALELSTEQKIEALNLALKDMVAGFAAESRLRAEIQVGLITFGGERARVHLPLAPAHKISEVSPLRADGRTPMGAAFEEARKLIEDKDMIPSRAYRPVLVLVSDGLPTDDWEQPLDGLCKSERGQKATRFAMAIGADADVEMLRRFANDPESPVFKAHEARDIHRFFRAVTMSVTSRSRSTAPNSSAPLVLADIPEDDDLDLDF